MNRKNQIPNSVYVTLGSGFVLGAIFMAGLAFEGTGGFSKAQGQSSLPNFEPRTISAPSRESTAEVKNLDAFYANLAAFVSPAVVDIRATSGREMSADGTRVPVSGGEGSGFILRPDGYIITNDHVVAGFDNVKVILKDGREFDGKVTRAHESDIAVIKINATNLPTLAFGDSDKLKPGQMAMAVGSPFSFQQSVTFGHISALGRERTQIEDRSYPDMIQTDTAINMGNSGGPLCNIDGQVVGLNTAIYSPSGTSAGIGLAIPSNEVRLIADKLIEKGKVVRSFIGVAPMNLTDYQKQQRHVSGGALVQEARESDPAGMAGVRKDDIIVRVGQTAVNTQMDLRNSMLQYAPGSSVDLEVIRGSEHKTFKVKLGEYKDPGLQGNSSRGFQRGQQGLIAPGGRIRRLQANVAPDLRPGDPAGEVIKFREGEREVRQVGQPQLFRTLGQKGGEFHGSVLWVVEGCGWTNRRLGWSRTETGPGWGHLFEIGSCETCSCQARPKDERGPYGPKTALPVVSEGESLTVPTHPNHWLQSPAWLAAVVSDAVLTLALIATQTTISTVHLNAYRTGFKRGRKIRGSK